MGSGSHTPPIRRQVDDGRGFLLSVVNSSAIRSQHRLNVHDKLRDSAQDHELQPAALDPAKQRMMQHCCYLALGE
jgi:hypothetical protein